MDDNRFDDFIKGKLGNYEDPDFDPAALADLHYRLASVTSLPWYRRYRTELLVVSSLILFTLLNMFWQYRVGNDRQQSLLQAIDSLKSSHQMIASLQQQLSTLKAATPDSLYTTEASRPSLRPSATLSDEIAALVSKYVRESKQDRLQAESLSKEVIALLLQQGWISNGEPSQDRVDAADLPWLPSGTLNDDLSPPNYAVMPVRPIDPQGTDKKKEPKEKYLSAATIRELQKHFQRGIGLRIGPAATLSRIHDQGAQGAIKAAGGFSTDWILSPLLSLEGGALYTGRYYRIEGPSVRQNGHLPAVDESLGTLEKIEIDSKVLEFPLAIKFSFLLSDRTNGVLSGGYTPLLYLRQDLEYSYKITNGHEGDPLFLSSSFAQSKARFYPGTLNAGIGLSRLLKHNNWLEFSLYYRYGLGETGVEQVRPSILGLRTVYWFTVF